MINNTVLVGRITKSLELKMTASNIPVCSFTLAVNRQFTSEDGEREADFISIVVWRKQAENLVKYCDKGSLIGVVGRIQTRNYETDNGTRYVTEVVADNIQFLDSKKDEHPQTDEEIDETFKHGSPVNKPSKNKQVESQYETSKQLAAEEDLPF